MAGWRITDWFKKDGLTLREHKKLLQPIEKGMLVELHTMEKFEALMRKNGLKDVRTEILNKHCAKTWDLCLDIIKDKIFWGLTAKNGIAFVHFLRAFHAMRDGYATGNFIYGLVVAEKRWSMNKLQRIWSCAVIPGRICGG